MKIRIGFVSNSSSSSFVAVGFNASGQRRLCKKVIKALKLPDNFLDGPEEYGLKFEKEGSLITDDGISLFMADTDIIYIGIDIEEDLENDCTVSSLKKKLQSKLKNIGVKINLSQIEFIVETFGWG